MTEDRAGMTHKPEDDEPIPQGGRAAERLREFIDQRFPDERPEGAPKEIEDEPPADAGERPEQPESRGTGEPQSE